MAFGLLFIRGANGTARFFSRQTGANERTVRCAVDNFTRRYNIREDSDVALAVLDLATHAQTHTGPPTVIADVTAFFGG